VKASRLLEELERLAPRGGLAAGQEITRTFEHGDLELEVVVRVRRLAAPDQIEAYRAAALERGGNLAAADHVGHGCQVYKQRKGRYGGGGGRCGGKVVAAAVYRWHGGKQPRFRFVCGHHREHHGVDPAELLAVVELPPRLLDPLREQWAAEQRRRAEERAARERAGLCGRCGKAEDDGSCGWHEVPRQRQEVSRG
jgi:hypothetical protein